MHQPHLMPRRQALRQLSAGALLALGLWPGALLAKPAPPSGSFRFAVVNDTHYLTPECGPFFEGFVRRMAAENVDFCLHAGDLTEKGLPAHLAAVRAIFRRGNLRVYPVMGNHDWTTPTDRQAYMDEFPSRLNYTFRHRGWQFVALDSTDGQAYDKTSVRPASLLALDKRLSRLNPARPTVLFTHFPLGIGMKYRPANAEEVLDRFLKFNLQAVFCGHWHGYTEAPLGDALITTNRCCSLKRDNHDKTKDKGFFVCTASQGRITRQLIHYPEAPAGT